MKTITSLVLALTIMGLLCFACTKSTPNPNDTTPPKVEIKVKKNGQYEVVPSAEVLSPLDLMCVVSDPEGVQYIKLEFLGGLADLCVAEIDQQNNVSVDLPDPQEITLKGDASEKVSTTLPIYFSLTQPKCKTVSGEGVPAGYIFTAKCTGKNWASQNDVKELQITVK